MPMHNGPRGSGPPNRPKDKPKVDAKTLLFNNLFIIKFIFKSYPLGVTLCALEKFRASVQVFFEHTWLINFVLECVEYHKSFEQAATAIIAVFIAIVISTVLGSIAWQKMWPKALIRAKTNMRNMIYEKAKEVDLEEFDNPEYYNDFVITVEKSDMIVERGWNMILTIADSLGGFFTTGIFFITQSWIALAIVLLSAFINLYFNLRRSALWYKKSVETQSSYRKADYTKRLFYLLDYAKELRLNPKSKAQAFETYDKSYDGLIEKLKFFDKKIVKMSAMGLFLSMLILDVALVLFLIYQASVLGTISYALGVVLINSAYRLRGNINRLITNISNSAESCMYVDKIKEFLKKEGKIVSKAKLNVTNEPKKIELKDVSFRYTDNSPDVLHNINLTIHPKEKIALVGYNGAGKTTLIKLIMRLYDATSGVILQDGKNIKDYDVEKYRKHIGVIFQDFNIYATSLKENVVMDLCDNVDDEPVKKSLASSGFGDRLQRLKNGLNEQLTTEFDDDGVNLSGGESQKVAVSRAFYKNAGLIILDEPSSALDPIAEYNLNKYMLNAAKDSSVIFISHRLSTTRIADKIFMLENGRVVESGSHEQLLKLNGKYAQMWHTQASQYLD